MKPYYHAHESAYRTIKENGFIGWGNVKTFSELGDEFTKKFLNSKISKYFSATSGKFALDLGCGTGTTAFIFAKAGFATTGIEISKTAIEIGKELARQETLDVHFVEGDALHLQGLGRKFDVIYDSHFFHCIVFEEDRTKVLNEIKAVLSEGGIFVLDTMIMPSRSTDVSKMFEPLRFDDDFILWHKTKTYMDRGVVEIDGQLWCAQRRIYPLEIVLAEISRAGFKIIEQQVDIQENEPSMLRMVLS